jgi:hypothetical protein
MAVADRLAAVNAQVAIRDSYVSPQCIVTWRLDGGNFQFFDGTKRIPQDVTLPAMGNGMDIRDLCDMMMPLYLKKLEGGLTESLFELSEDDVRAGLEKINNRPKRKL